MTFPWFFRWFSYSFPLNFLGISVEFVDFLRFSINFPMISRKPSQTHPKRLPRHSQTAPGDPKEATCHPQGVPKTPQETPKTAQETSQGTPEATQKRPQRPQMTSQNPFGNTSALFRWTPRKYCTCQSKQPLGQTCEYIETGSAVSWRRLASVKPYKFP